MSELEYDRMLAVQGGACAICGAQSPGSTKVRFAVDHCHTTGRVRGLLCMKCNPGIGYFDDRPELLRRAADYLAVS